MTDEHGEFVPPHTTAGQDLWHVLIVGDPDNHDDCLWLHPAECGVSVSTRMGHRYECQTADALDHSGYDGMFHQDDSLRRGTWLVRPYIEKIVGPTWTEYDSGWEVVRLVEGEYEAAPLSGSSDLPNKEPQ